MKLSRIKERLATFPQEGDDCWFWTPSRLAGTIKVEDGPTQRTHRAIYELLVGPIPPGYDLDHRCFNDGCVRPSHMEPVTHSENLKRRRPNYHKVHEASKTFWIRLSEEEANQVEHMCREEHRSYANLLKVALAEYWEANYEQLDGGLNGTDRLLEPPERSQESRDGLHGLMPSP